MKPRLSIIEHNKKANGCVRIFDSYDDFITKTEGRNLYMKLSNGYNVPVERTALKALRNCMERNGSPFSGKLYLAPDTYIVQVAFDEK